MPIIEERKEQMASEDSVLDLSGLKCPLPALRVRKALAGMTGAGRLKVVCSDPMAAIDVPNAVREGGGFLLGQWRDGEHLWFHIGRDGE